MQKHTPQRLRALRGHASKRLGGDTLSWAEWASLWACVFLGLAGLAYCIQTLLGMIELNTKSMSGAIIAAIAGLMCFVRLRTRGRNRAKPPESAD